MTTHILEGGSELEADSQSARANSISANARVDVIPIVDVDDSLREQWGQLRASSPSFRTPFFSPAFIEPVGKLIPNVEVAVAQRDGKAVAVFPFQRFKPHSARPVGAGINDAHGLIAAPNCNVSLLQVMEHAKLWSFPFHAAPRDSSNIRDFELGTARSFLADLTVDELGYEHYLRSQSHTIDRQGQKSRRLARDLGTLRLEFDCRSSELLDYLIDLKCDQYQRTHTFNILNVPWIRKLLHNLHSNQESSVRGLLSVLFAGETPVALHYGMVEGDLLHYWFPVFDPKYAYGSPGTQLFLDIANEAGALGYTAIDMGYGEQSYKYKLTNVITEMGYGLVDQNPWRRAWHQNKLAVRNRWKQLSFRNAIKPLARRILPSFGKSSYEP